MRTTDAAIENDPDWKKTLWRYQEDPTEGYLHTVLPTGEVLPFSEAVAIAYEYPCTLGKQQEGLHKRVVFSSTTSSGSMEKCNGATPEAEDRVGYVGDEVCEEDRPNPDIVSNKWNWPGSHYECHHPECVVLGTARLYFITEEEYLAHWNAFHAAVSPWYVCSTAGCEFVVPGTPDAFDCYMMHVQQCHVTPAGTGGLEREDGDKARDSIRWGVNPCFLDVGLKDRHPPPRRMPVKAPGDTPVIGARWAARQQMDSLCRDGFPNDSFKDHSPYWGEYKNRTRGGTNYKHQREKEVRRQKVGEGKRQESEVPPCYSPVSSSSRTADETTPAERLRLVAGMVWPALPCGGFPLSAALTYEDAIADGKADRVVYWTYQRVMESPSAGDVRSWPITLCLSCIQTDGQRDGTNGDGPEP